MLERRARLTCAPLRIGLRFCIFFIFRFTSQKLCAIMKEPNKLNIFERGGPPKERGVPFFAALNFSEFGKNANSAKLGVAKGLFPRSVSTCLATIGVCVFRCADFS